MIRIIEGRSTGKTKELIKKASETGGIVACKNVYSTRTKAVAYGFYNVKFINYYDLMETIDTMEVVETDEYLSNVYIDELEEFVNWLLANGLAGYTLTKED